MKIELEAGGKTVAVEAQTAGAAIRVRIDGRERRAEAVWVSTRELSLMLDGQSYDMEVISAGPDAVDVAVAGHIVRVSSGGGDSARAVASRRHASGGRLTAPMPGKVVAVLVEPGDQVVIGQGLVVVEAMKMENELQSPSAGRIKSIRVEPGQVVDGGALLVELD